MPRILEILKKTSELSAQDSTTIEHFIRDIQKESKNITSLNSLRGGVILAFYFILISHDSKELEVTEALFKNICNALHSNHADVMAQQFSRYHFQEGELDTLLNAICQTKKSFFLNICLLLSSNPYNYPMVAKALSTEGYLKAAIDDLAPATLDRLIIIFDQKHALEQLSKSQEVPHPVKRRIVEALVKQRPTTLPHPTILSHHTITGARAEDPSFDLLKPINDQEQNFYSLLKKTTEEIIEEIIRATDHDPLSFERLYKSWLQILKDQYDPRDSLVAALFAIQFLPVLLSERFKQLPSVEALPEPKYLLTKVYDWVAALGRHYNFSPFHESARIMVRSLYEIIGAYTMGYDNWGQPTKSFVWATFISHSPELIKNFADFKLDDLISCIETYLYDDRMLTFMSLFVSLHAPNLVSLHDLNLNGSAMRKINSFVQELLRKDFTQRKTLLTRWKQQTPDVEPLNESTTSEQLIGMMARIKPIQDVAQTYAKKLRQQYLEIYLKLRDNLIRGKSQTEENILFWLELLSFENTTQCVEQANQFLKTHPPSFELAAKLWPNTQVWLMYNAQLPSDWKIQAAFDGRFCNTLFASKINNPFFQQLTKADFEKIVEILLDPKTPPEVITNFIEKQFFLAYQIIQMIIKKNLILVAPAALLSDLVNVFIGQKSTDITPPTMLQMWYAVFHEAQRYVIAESILIYLAKKTLPISDRDELLVWVIAELEKNISIFSGDTTRFLLELYRCEEERCLTPNQEKAEYDKRLTPSGSLGQTSEQTLYTATTTLKLDNEESIQHFITCLETRNFNALKHTLLEMNADEKAKLIFELIRATYFNDFHLLTINLRIPECEALIGLAPQKSFQIGSQTNSLVKISDFQLRKLILQICRPSEVKNIRIPDGAFNISDIYGCLQNIDGLRRSFAKQKGHDQKALEEFAKEFWHINKFNCIEILLLSNKILSKKNISKEHPNVLKYMQENFNMLCQFLLPEALKNMLAIIAEENLAIAASFTHLPEANTQVIKDFLKNQAKQAQVISTTEESKVSATQPFVEAQADKTQVQPEQLEEQRAQGVVLPSHESEVESKRSKPKKTRQQKVQNAIGARDRLKKEIDDLEKQATKLRIALKKQYPNLHLIYLEEQRQHATLNDESLAKAQKRLSQEDSLKREKKEIQGICESLRGYIRQGEEQLRQKRAAQAAEDAREAAQILEQAKLFNAQNQPFAEAATIVEILLANVLRLAIEPDCLRHHALIKLLRQSPKDCLTALKAQLLTDQSSGLQLFAANLSDLVISLGDGSHLLTLNSARVFDSQGKPLASLTTQQSMDEAPLYLTGIKTTRESGKFIMGQFELSSGNPAGPTTEIYVEIRQKGLYGFRVVTEEKRYDGNPVPGKNRLDIPDVFSKRQHVDQRDRVVVYFGRHEDNEVNGSAYSVVFDQKGEAFHVYQIVCNHGWKLWSAEMTNSELREYFLKQAQLLIMNGHTLPRNEQTGNDCTEEPVSTVVQDSFLPDFFFDKLREHSDDFFVFSEYVYGELCDYLRANVGVDTKTHILGGLPRVRTFRDETPTTSDCDLVIHSVDKHQKILFALNQLQQMGVIQHFHSMHMGEQYDSSFYRFYIGFVCFDVRLERVDVLQGTLKTIEKSLRATHCFTIESLTIIKKSLLTTEELNDSRVHPHPDNEQLVIFNPFHTTQNIESAKLLATIDGDLAEVERNPSLVMRAMCNQWRGFFVEPILLAYMAAMDWGQLISKFNMGHLQAKLKAVAKGGYLLSSINFLIKIQFIFPLIPGLQANLANEILSSVTKHWMETFLEELQVKVQQTDQFTLEALFVRLMAVSLSATTFAKHARRSADGEALTLSMSTLLPALKVEMDSKINDMVEHYPGLAKRWALMPCSKEFMESDIFNGFVVSALGGQMSASSMDVSSSYSPALFSSKAEQRWRLGTHQQRRPFNIRRQLQH